jgi:hypothetical protein
VRKPCQPPRGFAIGCKPTPKQITSSRRPRNFGRFAEPSAAFCGRQFLLLIVKVIQVGGAPAGAEGTDGEPDWAAASASAAAVASEARGWENAAPASESSPRRPRQKPLSCMPIELPSGALFSYLSFRLFHATLRNSFQSTRRQTIARTMKKCPGRKRCILPLPDPGRSPRRWKPMFLIHSRGKNRLRVRLRCRLRIKGNMFQRTLRLRKPRQGSLRLHYFHWHSGKQSPNQQKPKPLWIDSPHPILLRLFHAIRMCECSSGYFPTNYNSRPSCLYLAATCILRRAFPFWPEKTKPRSFGPSPEPCYIFFMKRIPVHSSCLKAVGYDKKHSVLEIEFSDQDVYRYFHVPERFYKGLLEAGSKGDYFETHIRKAGYAYRHL